MITYLKGDATLPQVEGPRLIAHIVNDRGAWGRGFVLALSKKWLQPEQSYRSWVRGELPDFHLGRIQLVDVAPNLAVCNMLAQRGLRSRENPQPVDYKSLRLCLENLRLIVDEYGYSVHMPRIGTGLGGGDWGTIETLIQECLAMVPVYVYDL